MCIQKHPPKIRIWTRASQSIRIPRDSESNSLSDLVSSAHLQPIPMSTAQQPSNPSTASCDDSLWWRLKGNLIVYLCARPEASLWPILYGRPDRLLLGHLSLSGQPFSSPDTMGILIRLASKCGSNWIMNAKWPAWKYLRGQLAGGGLNEWL